jgi:TonB family protein
VSFLTLRRSSAGATILIVLGVALATGVSVPAPVLAQELLTRKVKTKVPPVYPDIARRMSITGVVKVSVVVAPNGTVKSTKVIGGHPLLVNAAMDAVKRWKFEASPEESTGVVEFKFESQD